MRNQNELFMTQKTGYDQQKKVKNKEIFKKW